jgi:hypothetical protein
MDGCMDTFFTVLGTVALTYDGLGWYLNAF